MVDKKGRYKKQIITVQHVVKMMWGQRRRSDFKIYSEIAEEEHLSPPCFVENKT